MSLDLAVGDLVGHADSLGLAEEEASGDSATFGCTVPPVEN